MQKPDTEGARRLTRDELILWELDAKNEAVLRYDATLWKIRSGYVLVLYGALSLLGYDVRDSPWLAFVFVLSFSILAFAIDYSFLHSRLRVVAAQNRLMDVALDLASGATNITTDALRDVLHVSGDNPELAAEARRLIWTPQNALLIVFLYGATPLVALTFALWR
jgi:hypothetical protein